MGIIEQLGGLEAIREKVAVETGKAIIEVENGR
jgi:hypothetical protein